MKFNKKKIRHWLQLVVGALFTVLAVVLRKAGLVNTNNTVIFYGHMLNGNLKAFYDYLLDEGSYKPVFVTLFPKYKKMLKITGCNVLTTGSLLDSIKIAKSKVIITDHGGHFLYPLYKHTDMKFIDVWHGIPYKGWDRDSFGEQKHYDEIWLSSSRMVEIYKEKYGFPNKLVATGYARTDPLVNKVYTKQKLTEKYGLPNNKKLILVAPTWKQDSQNRSIIPFDTSIESFFSTLDKLGAESNSLVIFRAHLNTGDDIDITHFKNVMIMSYAEYPIAEEFLGGVDLLVTDWSSIAFDFLVTGKPVVYLDVEPPFEKGLTLDGSYRFGPIVGNLQDLHDTAIRYTGEDSKYQKDFKHVIDKTMKAAYGDLADGEVSERYMQRLNFILKEVDSA